MTKAIRMIVFKLVSANDFRKAGRKLPAAVCKKAPAFILQKQELFRAQRESFQNYETEASTQKPERQKIKILYNNY